MNRPERIATLVQLLASHPGLTLEELSAVLGNSRRTTVKRIKEVVDAGFHVLNDNGYHLQLDVPPKRATQGSAQGSHLQGAIDQLVEHPAIRGDPSLVNSLKEIAKFAAARDKVQASLLDHARQGSGITLVDPPPPPSDPPTEG